MHSEKFWKTEVIIGMISILFVCSCGTQHQLNSSGKYFQLKEKYARTLDVTPSEIRNVQLYAFIDEWMNAPYKYGGLSKKGVDCSGFTSLLFDSVYHKKISGSSSDLFNLASPVSNQQLKEGDLVFFKINSSKVSHVGTYLLHDKFVHASVQGGVIISDLNEPYYKKYFYAAGRIR